MRRETLTFAEVARLYGTRVKLIREAVTRGELPTTRLRGRLFILRAAVEERLGKELVLPGEEKDDVDAPAPPTAGDGDPPR